ncbi:MAG: HD domain-containing protein [Candidatus Altiarchaeales archaeon]|nr:HD domain-containing protein [Candidatus Altiarchaeales archaeon]
MVAVTSKGSRISFGALPEPGVANKGFRGNQERADFLEKVGRTGRYIKIYFDRHQDEISAAHNFGHVNRVATYAAQIAEALGADERTCELARAAGYLHDRVRYPNEGKKHGGPSAEKTGELMRYPLLNFSERDRSIILNAIENHETNPVWWKDADRRDSVPHDSKEIVQTAVRIADAALEANGPYVLARRAAFVSGERLHEGDLKDKDLTPAEAFAAESFIRLRTKNPKDAYPTYMRSLVDGLFQAQYKLYYPLLKTLGLTEGKIAKLAQDKGLGGAEKSVEVAGTLNTDENINQSSLGEGEAALEVIKYFSKSSVYRQDLSESIRAWIPETQKAKVWQKEMMEYLDGKLNVKGKIMQTLT